MNIPPLRERKEDIPILVKAFIEEYNNLLGKNIRGIEKELEEKLMEYNWPGNIRELRNILESAITMADDNSVLNSKLFESRIFNNSLNKSLGKTYESSNNIDTDGEFDLDKHMTSIEINIIKSVLKKNNYNISKASRQLNISRQNLQHKIKKYNII